jgi:hypothetical protein
VRDEGGSGAVRCDGDRASCSRCNAPCDRRPPAPLAEEQALSHRPRSPKPTSASSGVARQGAASDGAHAGALVPTREFGVLALTGHVGLPRGPPVQHNLALSTASSAARRCYNPDGAPESVVAASVKRLCPELSDLRSAVPSQVDKPASLPHGSRRRRVSFTIRIALVPALCCNPRALCEVCQRPMAARLASERRAGVWGAPGGRSLLSRSPWQRRRRPLSGLALPCLCLRSAFCHHGAPPAHLSSSRAPSDGEMRRCTCVRTTSAALDP